MKHWKLMLPEKRYLLLMQYGQLIDYRLNGDKVMELYSFKRWFIVCSFESDDRIPQQVELIADEDIDLFTQYVI